MAGEARAATGDLHVHSGALPDGQPTVVGPWAGLTSNTPGGTGTYGLNAGPVGEGYAATSSLTPPSNLAFAKAAAYRSYTAPPSSNHSQPQVSTTWENAGWPYTGGSGGGGFIGDAATGPVSINTPSSLSTRIACVAFDGVPGSCTGGVSYLIQRLDLTLNDAEGPTISGPMSGELLDGTWKTSATGEVRFTAADVGSGVYRAWMREGSITHYASVDPSSLRCRDAYTANADPYDFVPSALSLVPCRTASTDYAPAFNLPAIGDGVHAGVSFGLEDAGGNERTVLTNRTLRINAPGGGLPDAGTAGPGGCIWAADGTTCTASGGGGGGGGGGAGAAGGVTPIGSSPLARVTVTPETPPAAPPALRACNGERCSSTARITVKAGMPGSQTIAVRYGGHAHVVGRLEAPDGAPIAGATVDVVAVSDRDGARAATRAAARTDATGQFVYDAPAGLSGAIAFSYRMHLDSADEAARYEVRVRMTAGVRLSVDPTRTLNKHAVTFTGRILGSPPRHRKVVELQARSEGRWVTFATARSDGTGRYRYRYRFERTFSRQTYGFRAVVRNETGWPFLTGFSNRVYVTVAP
ncbi:hypothetical protein [Capillimicrobium parvum]|nr:hypothetical protein [Capillimicrobium parvum]